MAKRTGVIDRDLGMKAIVKELGKLSKKPYVAIGVQGTSALAAKKGSGGPTRATVVDVATFHEFGVPADSPDKTIPERSFIRSTRDENDSKYQAQLEVFGKELTDPRSQMTVEKALTTLGMEVQKDVQNKFNDNDWPELKDPTRGGKNPEGGAKPLIDTGQLRQSIRYQVVKDGRTKK